MSCNCKLHLKRLNNLKKKYTDVRKKYKKLIGMALLLTDALEKVFQGEEKAKINQTLMMCSAIYEDLYSTEISAYQKSNDRAKVGSKDLTAVADESGKPSESDKEYFEGFMARPRIPRTPQV